MTDVDLRLWERKIEAFLFTPPSRCLNLEGTKSLAQNLIATALGYLSKDKDTYVIPREIEEANEIAAGSDVPAFIDKVASNIFFNNPQITHPLSGEVYELSIKETLQQLDLQEFESIIIDAVKEIREEIANSQEKYKKDGLHKRLFLALWRRLPDVIREKERFLANVLDILPFDPRVPSHTVWEHMSVASAIAGAKEPTLLIFTLGSAQSFISTARRTQDFWAGSFLLSNLIWEAIKEIAENCGPDAVLFPSLREQPLVDSWLYSKGIAANPNAKTKHEFLDISANTRQIASFPNIFTAIVPSKDAETLVKKVEGRLEKYWQKVVCAVQVKVENLISECLGREGEDFVKDLVKEWEPIWKRQREAFFDQLGVFWVVCPWGNAASAAAEAYSSLFEGKKDNQYVYFTKTANHLNPQSPNIGTAYPFFSYIAASSLKSRKLLRDFKSSDETGWKCSLCGLREVLYPSLDTLRKLFINEKNKSQESLIKLFWEFLSQLKRKDSFGKTDEEDKFRLQGHIRRGERLCSICLTKRLALGAYFHEHLALEPTRVFPSTSTLATAAFKEDLINNLNDIKVELKNYVEQIKAFLEKNDIFHPSSSLPKLKKALAHISDPEDKKTVTNFLKIDGEWLYEESFNIDKIIYEYPKAIEKKDVIEKSLIETHKSLKALLKKSEKLNLVPPSRYYAIISMDGDKTSQWLSGYNAPSLQSMLHKDSKETVDPILEEENWFFKAKPIKRVLGASLHLSLSTILKHFAIDIVPEIVENQNLGKLVYAGGDDVIALVSTRDMLNVMQQLKALFQGENLNNPLPNIKTANGFAEINLEGGNRRLFPLAGASHKLDESEELFHSLTISAGVAIMHESTPLAQAIDESLKQAMKKKAKEELGRDAFAINLCKRAGGLVSFGMKWKETKEASSSQEVIELLKELVEHIRTDELSAKLKRYTL